jgi:hypothetical protein
MVKAADRPAASAASTAATERPCPRFSGIDAWEPQDALDAMIEAQFAAVAAVRAARGAIAGAVAAMEGRLASADASSMPVPALRGAWRCRTAPS